MGVVMSVWCVVVSVPFCLVLFGSICCRFAAVLVGLFPLPSVCLCMSAFSCRCMLGAAVIRDGVFYGVLRCIKLYLCCS